MLIHHGEYSYVIEVSPLNPPMSGNLKFVAKVDSIVKNGVGGPQRFDVQIDEYYGETESEAIQQAKAEADEWIGRQPH